MKKIVLIGIIGIVTLLGANEPSVYGAGDIDSIEPYGLTATERNVLANRKQVQLLTNRVAEQQNRIDGLTSIIEGLNKQIVELKDQLKNREKESGGKDSYALLLQMGELLDQINNNYVTQEDLRAAIEGRAIPKRVTQSNSSNSTVAKDVSEVYREGVKLFARKSYNASKEKFEEALAHNYKAAPSNYYLGEIAYYTGNYKDAIAYYKKSASIYDQASYMKVLYLHTAISLARTGEQEKAKNFFQYVIDHYPGTKAASIAQKNL
jgi:TolA-binding protein